MRRQKHFVYMVISHIFHLVNTTQKYLTQLLSAVIVTAVMQGSPYIVTISTFPNLPWNQLETMNGCAV